MSDPAATRRARRLWWAMTPLLPTAALQGSRLRKRIPLLPEATGTRTGVEGEVGREALSIAVIGESTAAGVGVAAQADALAAQLARALATSRGARVRWQAVGRTGLTIAKAERELLPELTHPVDLVVAVFGVNDVLKLTPERTWRSSLYDLARALSDRGARHVLFTAAPPFDSFVVLPQPLRATLGIRARFLNAILRDVVADVPSASVVTVEALRSDEDLSSDQFHPSAQGYEKWARMIASHLAHSFR